MAYDKVTRYDICAHHPTFIIQLILLNSFYQTSSPSDLRD